MRRRDRFRRHFANKLLPQAAQPAAAAAAAAASSATAPPSSTTTPFSPFAPADLPSSSPIQPLFPVMVLVENSSSSKMSSPRPVFVSLSSDLRLIDVKPGGSAPTSLLAFRSPDCRIPLERLPNPSSDTTRPQSIEDIVKPFVRSLSHADGPAVRFCDGNQGTILVAENEEERNAFLSALCQRLAPLALLRERLEAEIREGSAATTSKTSSALCLAARSVFRDEAGTPAVRMAKEIADASGRVEGIAGKMADVSAWTATHGKAIGELVRMAEGVEKLTKPFGAVSVVGCAFSLVSLSAGAVRMVALEVEGKEKLREANMNLRKASMMIVDCLFFILSSGFGSNTGLADEVFGSLWECSSCAEELEQYLLRGRVGRVRKAKDIVSIVSRVEDACAFVFGAKIVIELVGYQIETDKRFRELESKAGKEDDFIPGIRDFGDLEPGLVADAAIELDKLKKAVLQSDASTREQHAVVSPPGGSARGVALVSVDGGGGVGKTSTCKLLRADPEIQKRFAEGAIIWITVGKDAVVDAVKEKMALAVDVCGGTRSAQLIRESTAPGISTAVGLARKFFSKHMILLVLDNVWDARRDSKVDSWAAELAEIASFQGSVVLMTTRFHRLAESGGFVPVHVGAYNLESNESLHWAIAENFYDALLGYSAEETSAYRQERRTALRLTCGIPLGITTFAALVRDRRRAGGNVDTVLSRIKKRTLGLADKFVGEDQKTRVGHRGLFAAMDESLLFLDEQKGGRIKPKPLLLREDSEKWNCRTWSAAYNEYPDKQLSSRYAALHMLPESSPSASLSILSALWHVRGIEEAYDIASFFVDIGLARWQGVGENALVLHDIQYEFCGLFSGMSPAGVLTKGFDVTVNGHALLLSSCESLLAFEKAGDKPSMWGRFCFNQSMPLNADLVGLRDYLAKHLLRHFCSAAPNDGNDSADSRPEIGAASKREIVHVLSDFFWLRGRFYSLGGRNSLLRDFASALESGLCQSDTDSLRRLLKSVMLVGDDVSCRSGGTFASSLVQLAQSVEAENSASDTAFFKQLSKCAAEETIVAWLKPVSGCCLKYERGVLREAAISSAAVTFVSCIGDGMHFVSLSYDGTVRVHDFVYMRAELVLEDICGILFIDVVQQNKANISPIIFSVNTDGAVRWSEISFDETGRVFVSSRGFVGHSNYRASRLLASKNGKFVVVGCHDGSVCVWEPDGDNTGSYVLKVRFLCSEDEAKEASSPGSVERVVVAESGHFVAAYTSGGGFCFWKEEKGRTERVGRLALIESQSHRTPRYMFLSRDESSLILLFSYPSEHKIWNVETGECRLLDGELPEIGIISYANLSDISDGEELGLSLLVGGSSRVGGDALVEYSFIGDKLEMVRMAHVLVCPSVFCSADFSDETGVSNVVVGGHDGSVRLLGSDAFDASRIMKQRKSGMSLKEAVGPSPALDSENKISAVAVMPDASFVVAGHWNGRLSLWSVEDGRRDRAIDSGRDANWINFIDIGADNRFAVTAHRGGAVLVWKTSTWTVRFALEGLSGEVICAAVLALTNRIVAVDSEGTWRVWDAERGGAALCAIETGAYDPLDYNVGLRSADESHFIWATRCSYFGDKDERWQAKVIHIGGHSVLFKADNHRDWDTLCAEVDSRLWRTEAIASWKLAAVVQNQFYDMRELEGKTGMNWEISCSGRRVQCASRSAEGEVSDKASISLDSGVNSIATQWLPDLGDNCRQRAVVACADIRKTFPLIMHFITPKE